MNERPPHDKEVADALKRLELKRRLRENPDLLNDIADDLRNKRREQ